jgi:hypothetical protein
LMNASEVLLSSGLIIVAAIGIVMSGRVMDLERELEVRDRTILQQAQQINRGKAVYGSCLVLAYVQPKTIEEYGCGVIVSKESWEPK